MGGVSSTCEGEEMYVQVYGGKTDGKRSHRRPRRTREDDMKIDI
jgi:hypothetical protein